VYLKVLFEVVERLKVGHETFDDLHEGAHAHATVCDIVPVEAGCVRGELHGLALAAEPVELLGCSMRHESVLGSIIVHERHFGVCVVYLRKRLLYSFCRLSKEER
jgi:hypothetical protein